MRVSFVIALSVCVLALASDPGAQAQAPQEATVNFLSQGEPDSLDPTHASFAYAVDGAVVRQVFEPLLRFDEKLTPEPAAAESYEVSLDGTTYTFHLRPDGRWSDGQPVIANDFVFAWKRLLASDSQYAPLFTQAAITNVSAPDDLTFQVQLGQPFGALPDLAALYMAAPQRPDIVDADPDGWASDPATYVGNGPFMLADWVHQDHLTLVPNPQYVAHLGWPVPSLSKVTMQMATNPEGVLASYKTENGNGPDWMLVPDVEANAVLDDPTLASQSRKQTELATFWLQFNNSHAPLNDVLVRRAIAKAIDREALVRDLAAGVGAPATSVIPPGMPGFQDGLGHELNFDAAGARALLAQAAPPAALSLTYVYPDTPSDLRRAQYLQDQLSTNLGVMVQLKPVGPADYSKRIATGDYDLAFGGWSADYPDPQDWLRPVFGCNAPFNTVQLCDSTFDQLSARADMVTSMTDRLGLYEQAQTELMQDVPVIPLFNSARLVLAKPWVASLKLTPLDEYPGSFFLDQVQILPH